MKRRFLALFAAVVATMLMTVPVLAGPLEEYNAAKAAQDKRYADYIVYQTNLAEFQNQQKAKEAERERIKTEMQKYIDRYLSLL